MSLQTVLDDMRKGYDLSSEPDKTAYLGCIIALENHESKHGGLTINVNGRQIECYGELCEDSNFNVICTDEENDVTWTDGVPEDAKTWSQVVDFFVNEITLEIDEISAI